MEKDVETKKSFFNNPLFGTKIKSANVKRKEMILGYLIGPFGALITNGLFQSQLNTYYTDVLGMTGASYGSFLALMMLLSTMLVVLGNLIVGRIIDRTRTSAGKARPFLLLSAPLVALSFILVFVSPSDNPVFQMIWTTLMYNFFFAVAYPMFFTAHSLMVPLSTRNQGQRGILSSIANVANLGAVALFGGMIFPMLLPMLGVDKSKWFIIMLIIGIVAFVCILIEYYFTRERITEEGVKLDIGQAKVPLKKQLKAVATNKFWWIIMIFYLLFQFSGAMKNATMVYFCNWIVGTYQDGITQTLLSILGGVPMAIAVVLVWPIAAKIGKNRLILLGCALGAGGGLIALIDTSNLALVAVGVGLKCLGSAPACYIAMALMADVFDHLEAKNGFRCDGLSMSIYSSIMVASSGVCLAIFNALISDAGYVSPTGMTTDEIANITQPDSVNTIITICYIVVEIIAYAAIALMLIFMNVEKNIKTDQEAIIARQKAEVLAQGGIWVEPQERLRLEQEEAERISEEARIIESKAYCAKKGLDFKAREAAYQEKKAAKDAAAKAKAEAKEAKKKK